MRLDPDSDGVALGTVNLGKLSDDVKDTVSLAWALGPSDGPANACP
jgi:hypothetical protein